jgi:hypothetical protein
MPNLAEYWVALNNGSRPSILGLGAGNQRQFPVQEELMIENAEASFKAACSNPPG